MNTVEIIKLVCIFIAIFFTLVNVTKIIYRDDIPVLDFALWAIGLTGFIYLQWMI